MSARKPFIIAAIALSLKVATRFIFFTDEVAIRQDNDLASIIQQLVAPEAAATRLQDLNWASQLRHRHIGTLWRFLRGRRIIEWTMQSHEALEQNHGVDLFLMPYEKRSSQLIDLFLKEHVEGTMGENVVMIGWAKAALALGCRRVLMFESYFDFVNHLDNTSNQMYILDYLSLPQLKDQLLLDPLLRQRSWEFAWWGRRKKEIQTVLKISEKYGFANDHALLPFNLTNAPVENVRMGILPTAITMNHRQTLPRVDMHDHCDAFFMGKSMQNVENSIPLIKLIEQKLFELRIPPDDVKLCSGFKTSHFLSFERALGFRPKYTVNVRKMKPTQFASLVGHAKVVVGSGSPLCSPTIIDAIYGGAVFMAPSRQFCSVETHPLFVKSDIEFLSLEEQADNIVDILRDGDRKQISFGGFNETSYSIEQTCQQLLRVIHKSFSYS